MSWNPITTSRLVAQSTMLAAMTFVAFAGILPLPAIAAQPPAPPPSETALYRPPRIALAQPAPGGNIPQDRPVVVFHFTPGEPADPIDAGSFAVSIDGLDRTSLFRITTTEGWGALAPAHADGALAPGVHQLAARICSSRGVCATVTTPVSIVATTETKAPTSTTPPDRRRTLLDLLLAAAKKLLEPK